MIKLFLDTIQVCSFLWHLHLEDVRSLIPDAKLFSFFFCVVPVENQSLVILLSEIKRYDVIFQS